jgi:hypothetical protein
MQADANKVARRKTDTVLFIQKLRNMLTIMKVNVGFGLIYLILNAMQSFFANFLSGAFQRRDSSRQHHSIT